MNLGEYLTALRRRIFGATLVLLVCVGSAVALSVNEDPVYQARSSVFLTVPHGQTVGELVQGSTYAQSVVRSFASVATMPIVLDPVIERLDLSRSARTLAHSVTALAPQDTVIIEVTVDDESPSLAADIANAIASELSATADKLAPHSDVGSAVTVTTVEEAQPPTVPTSPNTRLNVAIGVVLGLVLAVLYAAARELLADLARPEDDTHVARNEGRVLVESQAARH